MKIALTLIWLVYMFFAVKDSLHMLQQNLYDDDHRYTKWINKNFSKIMLSFPLLQILLIPLALFVGGLATEVTFLATYLLLATRNFVADRKKTTKKPLVLTAKVKLLLVTIFAIVLLTILAGLNLGINYYAILAFIGYFVYYIMRHLTFFI